LTGVFDIGPDHSANNPVLRRLKSPDTASEAYWNFSTGLMADVAADLVGPNVVFHHSKLNFKWFDASDTVKWHQDIQFFPHTNYNVLTIGCYLADTTMDNGCWSPRAETVIGFILVGVDVQPG
jgi:ectoine hydroxylase